MHARGEGVVVVSDPVVDVHCHVFNADDLPVRGFVQHLHLDTPVLGPLLSMLLDRIVQDQAPGYEQDMARLQHLLATSAPGPASAELEVVGQPTVTAPVAGAGLAEQADIALAELTIEDPVFVRRLTVALDDAMGSAQGGGQGQADAENLADKFEATKRAVRWAKLFGMSRVDVASELVANFSNSVDLFCPLLVDLGVGLGDRPKTTMRQQVEMLEAISILSMRGKLPGGGKARLHPFVGFDPRAQVRAVLAGQPITPLDVVKSAVLDHGFVGVKVYPPMGWKPLGNTVTIDMTAAEAKRLDAELRKFYSWCQEDEVPVTAHANRSNFADPSFADFAGPTGWQQALQEFPDLHVDLGHFGGAKAITPPTGWPWAMANLAVSRPHVYADVGNHRIDDPTVAAGYLDTLEAIFADPSTTEMDERLMYGSDWFMLAILPEHEQFLSNYRTLYQNRFHAPRTKKFMGRNALSFLGFDDANNKNAGRLAAHYARHAAGREPSWLKTP
jgi:predicted TIM-barrel fold metal-dependent hydrolase